MRGKFALSDPDKVEADMLITMTLGDWRKLRASLTATDSPTWQLHRMIGELIDLAQSRFCKDDEP